MQSSDLAQGSTLTISGSSAVPQPKLLEQVTLRKIEPADFADPTCRKVAMAVLMRPLGDDMINPAVGAALIAKITKGEINAYWCVSNGKRVGMVAIQKMVSALGQRATLYLTSLAVPVDRMTQSAWDGLMAEGRRIAKALNCVDIQWDVDPLSETAPIVLAASRATGALEAVRFVLEV